MEQLQEIQLLVRDLVQYGCVLPDSFQVNAILAKLPPSWRDFVTSHRHMKKQMTLTKLSAMINVEERARSSNKPSQQFQAHIVEKGGDRKFQKKKNSPQKNLNQPKSKKMKKKKEDFICYVCGVSGHTARRCKLRKGKCPPPQHKEGNMVVNSTPGYAPQAFMASPLDDWWMDSGATVHICADRSMFFFIPGTQQCTSLDGKWCSGSSSRYWTGLPEVNFMKDARAEGRILCALDEPEPHISVAAMSTGSQISV
jgi:hypothetical protein